MYTYIRTCFTVQLIYYIPSNVRCALTRRKGWNYVRIFSFTRVKIERKNKKKKKKRKRRNQMTLFVRITRSRPRLLSPSQFPLHRNHMSEVLREGKKYKIFVSFRSRTTTNDTYDTVFTYTRIIFFQTDARFYNMLLFAFSTRIFPSLCPPSTRHHCLYSEKDLKTLLRNDDFHPRRKTTEVW